MEKIQIIVLMAVPLLFSLSVHEAAHAWMANRKGDPTAKMLGRLTLNPLAHIDPVWTIAIPVMLAIMGWPILGAAKPVPVNERNLRDPLGDGLWIAAAGPVSNLILAVVFTFLLFTLNHLPAAISEGSLSRTIIMPLQYMVTLGIQLNVILAIFNLLPFPPLDGSRVAAGLFPAWAPALRQIERFGVLIILALFYTGAIHFLILKPTIWITTFLIRFTI